LFRIVQNHPLALLVAGGVLFSAWLWYDATTATAHTAQTERPEIRRAFPPRLPHELPPGGGHQLIAHLPPGAPRVIVEGKLGLHPLPHGVSPVEYNSGTATYTVTYAGPEPALVLEFDATEPGHPLIGPRS
jgi:hypothetical protein